MLSYLKTTLIHWIYQIKLDRPVHGFVFGHPAYQDVKGDGLWKWSDTNRPIEKPINRECKRCKMKVSDSGHDPCIANLSDIEYACCGHGVNPGYISYSSGRVERFLSTKRLMKKIRK